MKIPGAPIVRQNMTGALIDVTDASVQRFAAAILAGGDTSRIFPARISECALTDKQKEWIRLARVERDVALKKKKRSLRMTSRRPLAKKPATKKLVRREKKKGKHRVWVTIVQGGAPGLGKRA